MARDENPDQTIRFYVSEEVWRRRQSRRELLLRAGQGVAGVAGASALFTAGARASSNRTSGNTIRLINYIDWIGKHEVANFKKATGITIQQIIINPDEARIAKLAADHNAADMLLLDPSDAGRLKQLGLLAKLDFSKIPNYKHVNKFARIGPFRPQDPYGVPSDYGRDGFVYRTDIVKEKPTSWKEFFALIPKYSGKVTLLDFESDTLSPALKALGHSANTRDQKQINAAGDLLIKAKPHVSALVTTNMLKPLLDGSGAMATDWDYDASTVIAQNPKVPLKWVDATDGTRAYLDAWSAVSTTKALPAVEQFMNFHLDPKNYAEFVNTLHISVLVDAARPYVKPSIKKDAILFPSKKVQSGIEFSLPRGLAQKYWDEAWANFKSA